MPREILICGTAGDFQFAHHAPGEKLGSAPVKPAPSKKGKKTAGGDLFASTEADFFGFKKSTFPFLPSHKTELLPAVVGSKPKPASQKPSSVVISSSTTGKQPQPSTAQQGLWSTPAPSAAFQQAASASAMAPMPRARTLAEIEQELLANRATKGQPMTLEEIESEMRRNLRVSAQPPQGLPSFVGGQQEQQQGFQAPPGAIPSGYQTQFPPPAGFPSLGEAENLGRAVEQMHAPPPLPQQQMYGVPPPATQGTANTDLVARMMGGDAVLDEERMNIELERKIRETEIAEGKRRRKAEKIAGMARYNDIMTQGESPFGMSMSGLCPC